MPRQFGVPHPDQTGHRPAPQAHPGHGFQTLPPPTVPGNFHMTLDQVIPVDAIQAAGKIVFHTVGDTGGVQDPNPQRIVAMHMDNQLQQAATADRPAFFYHLGDVVYYNGEAEKYYEQFYDPYAHYTAPIFAIPGNHDGDPLTPNDPSLQAFVENFCAQNPAPTWESRDSGRDAMTEPNVYFTLDAPFVRIVGLYTNVPEHGDVRQPQIDWFTNELQNRPDDKAFLVALHHPIYSLDTHHGASDKMGELLDNAISATGKKPDAVFTAHVHNYQRFTRSLDGWQIPYIVAGAGGYHNLHYVQSGLVLPSETPFPDVVFESYCDNRHGFLRMTVTASGQGQPRKMVGEYFAVSRPQESWRDDPTRVDSFTLDLDAHQLVLPNPMP